MSAACPQCPLVRVLRAWQRDAATEIARRQRGPGGQQAGAARLGSWPLSALVQVEREARHALEAAGDEGGDA